MAGRTGVSPDVFYQSQRKTLANGELSEYDFKVNVFL